MLEIEPNDIANLNDTDLRVLVGLLCEAELESRRLPISAITYGGDQNAKDGGIDVSVELQDKDSDLDFIPRPVTGFQVKKPDLSAAEIAQEMCPLPSEMRRQGELRRKGVLRKSITKLAKMGGAYIIVSAASLSDLQLKNRRDAMSNIVNENIKADSLHIDFYDRTRLATWVRSYPGVTAWVREKCGRKINGWSPFDCWSTAAAIGEDYLLDDSCRLRASGSRENVKIIDGIRQLKALLQTPGRSVRMIGLSGTGKTRLAQALFESAVMDDALPKSIAIYADLGDSPEPPPVHMIERIQTSGKRAIVIVDNCSSDLHGKLAAKIKKAGSQVSLLTIEFDIREDFPEETEVFELEVSSTELIEALIAKRRPDLSQPDRRRLAEDSGGNARVALALAGALETGRSTADLGSRELFQRLFWQRNQFDRILERVAQACSLVYSFDGENISEDSELATIARLAEVSISETYRAVIELSRRGLMQTRNRWKALLPQPIANTLALQALELLPHSIVVDTLVGNRPSRLAVSFSRRLGFLHENQQIVALAEEWLSPQGLLGRIGLGDETLAAVYRNIVPISPTAWLDALRRNLIGNERQILERPHIIHDVRSIAYESGLFEAASEVLVHLALKECRPHHQSARQALQSLFQLYLSGTHAGARQRSSVISRLLEAADLQQQTLGIELLRIYLSTGHYINPYRPKLGSRSRNYGYQPRTWDEVRVWFTQALEMIQKFGVSPSDVGEKIRSLFAESFRNLWKHGNVYDGIENCCRILRDSKFWPDGLSAVRKTIYYEGKNMPADYLVRLKRLETLLQSETLLDKSKLMFRSCRIWDEVVSQEEQFTLGATVARSASTFKQLLPELVRDSGTNRFGAGLASATADVEEMWRQLAFALSDCPERDRRVHVLSGFLSQVQLVDPLWVDKALDEAVQDSVLGLHFLDLQTSLKIDEKSIQRIRRAATIGLSPLSSFRGLHFWGTEPGFFPDLELTKIALAFLEHGQEGFEFAVESICWRLKKYEDAGTIPPPVLIESGKFLLDSFSDVDGSDKVDYDLGVLAKFCLAGLGGAELTSTICKRLMGDEFGASRLYEFFDLLENLIEVHPREVLDVLVGTMNEDETWVHLDLYDSVRPNPLDKIPEQVAFAWAIEEPSRLSKLARLFSLFHQSKEDEPYEWTALAVQMLEAVEDKMRLLPTYLGRLSPTSWSGSLADTMERRLPLFDSLPTHGFNEEATALLNASRLNFIGAVKLEREAERREHSNRFERFE